MFIHHDKRFTHIPDCLLPDFEDCLVVEPLLEDGGCSARVVSHQDLAK